MPIDPAAYTYFESGDDNDAAAVASSQQPRTPVKPLPFKMFESPSSPPSSSKQNRIAHIRHELDALALDDDDNASAQAAELRSELQARIDQKLNLSTALAAATSMAATPATARKPGVLGAARHYSRTISAEELAALEQRVAKLEADVYSPTRGAGFNLAQAVARLESRVASVSEESVAAAARKARVLIDELNQLQRLQRDGGNAGSSARVDEMFAMLERVDCAAQQIPLVIGRLQALKDVHQSAVLHTAQLSGVEAAVAELRAQLATDRSVLDSLAASVEDNIARMETNAAWMRANSRTPS